MKNVDARYEQESKESGLKYGIIEVTTFCQNRCPGCYMVQRNELTRKEMTLTQAIRVLDLCREYIGQELETMDILGGEPTTWSFLKEYIEELLRRNIQPWIFTNMLSISEELAKWLFEREVHITGKLNIADFSNPEQLALQARMIGVGIKSAKLMQEKIELLLKTGYRNPLLRLQNLIRKENICLVPDYYRFCMKKEIGVDLEMMGSGEEIGPEYWEVAPTPQQIAEMVMAVQKVRAEFSLDPAEVLMPHIFGSCPFYDKGLYFAVDGHIRACTNSTFRLAYVDDPSPIQMAFESQLISCRKKLCKEVVAEPCHSCDKWNKCRGGCRATTEGMGNPFGAYPLCPVPYLK
jgi:radical SAM protein with 4Fe4S-binding SPASM domain